MSQQKTLSCFMFAGEQSGDLLGSHLIQALHKKMPHMTYTGVGGPKMRQQGLSPIIPMEEFQVMGLSDVLKALPRLWKHFYAILNEILNTNPDICILIDYPGFNMRLAKALRKRGYKNRIVQYVCPTVWAHGKKRIEALAATLDLLLVILPFEAAYFESYPLTVHYTGHPLIDIISKYHYNDDWWKIAGLPSTENVIALFPGSRTQEIKRNLPIQLQAAERLNADDPTIHFAISIARPELEEVVTSILKDSSLYNQKRVVFVPSQYSYELMRDCRTAIAKSGTVVLELALHHTPTVVVYALSSLNRLYAKYFLKLNLPHYSLVNIIGNRCIYPELIKEGFTPDNLYELTKELHREGTRRQQCMDDCRSITTLLNNNTASSANESAAMAIEKLLKEPCAKFAFRNKFDDRKAGSIFYKST